MFAKARSQLVKQGLAQLQKLMPFRLQVDDQPIMSASDSGSNVVKDRRLSCALSPGYESSVSLPCTHSLASFDKVVPQTADLILGREVP